MTHVLLVDQRLCRERRMARSILTGARLQDASAREGSRRVRVWFITLTYAPGQEWGSKDISRAAQAFTDWCARRGIKCRYVWKAEMQERGAVHYHLMAWLPKGYSMPKWDKQGWWPWGMTQRVEAFAATKYLAKYSAKGIGCCGVNLPRGARCFGVRGLNSSSRAEVRYWNFPSYVREKWGADAIDVVKEGATFVNRVTGETLESKYQFVSCFAGRTCLVLKSMAHKISISWTPSAPALG